jgi:hypothetical protein
VVDADANSLANPDGFVASPNSNYSDTNRHTVGHSHADTKYLRKARTQKIPALIKKLLLS